MIYPKAIEINVDIYNEKKQLLFSNAPGIPHVYLEDIPSFIPGIMERLNNKPIGYTFDFTLKPEEAFGDYTEKLIQRLPKKTFKQVDQLKVGDRINVQLPGGEITMHIKQMTDSEIIVDMNPTHAGSCIRVIGEIINIRPATEVELAVFKP